jgi:hypothetical protein
MTNAVAVRRAEKKIPVEQLQEQHLSGPADESREQAAIELKVDEIVITHEKPQYESVIFRNQRDPGYPLDFHYASKTHPFKIYKLIDGHQYQLPTEVIKNLEKCRENIHKYRKNGDGLPEIYIAGYKTHFVCERA